MFLKALVMPFLASLLFLESWNAKIKARNAGSHRQAQYPRVSGAVKEEDPGCLKA